MANVRCITMQRNENKLLDAWVRHHGYLFGFENIYVVDNGSDDPFVINNLIEFERCGANIIWDYNTRKDFDEKGTVLSNIIKKWDDNDENYDFVVTIDTDEFLYLRNSKIDISRSAINNYFDSLIGKQFTFIINKMMLISPYSCELYIPYTVPKAIFAKKTIKSLDLGYHRPRTIQNYPDLSLDLGYFHLHHKTFTEVKEAATVKLSNDVDVNDIEKLKSYSGRGHHLIKFFLMTEDEYRHMYDNEVLFLCPELFYILKLLGADVKKIFNTNETPQKPFITSLLEEQSIYPKGFLFRVFENSKYNFGYFDDQFYFNTQPDIRRLSIDPLVHFAQYGYREKRPWSPLKEKIEVCIEEKPTTI